MTVQVRHDRERGCGWRKEGGLYFIADGLAFPCGALPIPLCRCPTCGNGIKATRGFTWIDAGALLAPAVALCQGPAAVNPDRLGRQPSCERCPMSRITGRQGLLWIGGAFYQRPEDFTTEALRQGVSRRISQIPKGFTLGETWVFLAHRQAVPGKTVAQLQAGEEMTWLPGVFHAFKPTAIEYVVKGDETDDELDRLVKRGVTPVRVQRVTNQTDLVEAEAR